MNPFLSVLVLLIVAGGITAMMYAFSVFFGPKNTSNPVKRMPFECGSEPIGQAQIQFPVKFYLMAVIFVIFDIEVVFLYPWAVLFRSLGWFGVIEMGIFILILTVGLVYIWKKGALEWR